MDANATCLEMNSTPSETAASLFMEEQRNMQFRNVYKNAVLTVIAGLLAWIAVAKRELPSVHAQPAQAKYAVEGITANWGSQTYQADLASAINGAAKGRELVTVLKHDQAGRYLAIYK